MTSGRVPMMQSTFFFMLRSFCDAEQANWRLPILSAAHCPY